MVFLWAHICVFLIHECRVSVTLLKRVGVKKLGFQSSFKHLDFVIVLPIITTIHKTSSHNVEQLRAHTNDLKSFILTIHFDRCLSLNSIHEIHHND